MTSLQKVIQYCRAWGVPYVDTTGSKRFVARGKRDHGPGAYDIVGWTKSPTIARVHTWSDEWPYLMHELAHATCRVRPRDVDEIVMTTGFEILSIRHLRLPMWDWSAWQAAFVVSDTIDGVREPEPAIDWCELPRASQKKLISEACRQTRAQGLFDPRGRPTFHIARLDRKPVSGRG